MLVAIGALISGILFVLHLAGVIATISIWLILAPLVIGIGLSLVWWLAVFVFALWVN